MQVWNLLSVRRGRGLGNNIGCLIIITFKNGIMHCCATYIAHPDALFFKLKILCVCVCMYTYTCIKSPTSYNIELIFFKRSLYNMRFEFYFYSHLKFEDYLILYSYVICYTYKKNKKLFILGKNEKIK